MAESPDDVPSLALSLFAAARLLDERAQAVVNEELRDVVARPALMRLLPWLEAGPARVTALARRADVSKQAVGQALKGCEARGWVVYEPDPVDRRATLVRLTATGHEAVRHGRAVLRRIERVLEDELGRTSLASLTDALQRIIEILETRQPSTLGRDVAPKTARRRR